MPDPSMSNAKLWDIKRRRAGEDKDIAQLITFILYLKYRLGNAERKVSEQRKHLNAIAVRREKERES